MTFNSIFNSNETHPFDFIGISIPQGTQALAIVILDNISRNYSDVDRPIIILGHSLPSNSPLEFLTNYPWAIVVHGWGEMALCDLVRGKPLNNIPNISFVTNTGSTTNSPKWSLLICEPKRINYSFFLRVEASRGCSYNHCTFCLRPVLRSNIFHQQVPLKEVLAVIGSLKEAGVRQFTFTDEDFIGEDLSRALEIAKGLKEIGDLNFSISCMADDVYRPSAKAEENKLRYQIFHALRDAGLSMVYCGAETFSNTQNKRYTKRTNVEGMIQGINLIKGLAINMEIGFILFDPFVVLDEIKENINVLLETGFWEDVKRLFSSLNVYKNTPYENWIEKKKLLKRFDLDLLVYEWDFENKDVNNVFLKCREWERQHYKIYAALRHVGRTDFKNNYAARYLKILRYQDLLFLQKVVANKDKNSILEEMYVMRLNSLKQLKQSLLNSRKLSEAGTILLHELSQIQT